MEASEEKWIAVKSVCVLIVLEEEEMRIIGLCRLFCVYYIIIIIINL